MPRVAVTHGRKTKTEPYFAALRDVGLEPFGVTPENPLESLADLNGLVLCGGSDVNPACYDTRLDPRTGELDRPRDVLEIRLLKEALALAIPVLAICRGMQLFNVVHGGTLIQHMEGHRAGREDRSRPVHDIEIEPGTTLAQIAGPGPHAVNSRHHQAVGRVGDGLVVSARAPEDGIIEALERPDLRFAIAVQWHPEDMAGVEAQRRLFHSFAYVVQQALPGPAGDR
jgi:putative glutamine amidotransferase